MVFIVIELVFDYCLPSLDTHDTDFSTVLYIPILQQSGLLRYPDGPYSDTLFTIQSASRSFFYSTCKLVLWTPL